jgi:hypothetical protein
MRLNQRHLPLRIIACLVLSGCAASPQPRAYIDNETAAAISVADSGWIFARERPNLAVHAQDYVTVTPVQVNRAGKRVVYLYCQLWSTIDRRGQNAIVPAQSELALIADDRRVPLPDSNSDMRRLGMGHAPVPLPNNVTDVRIAPVEIDLLQSIAGAGEVRVALNTNGATEYFLTWRSGRAAFTEFLQRSEVR